ncbi:MAG TPA: hypothetical protein VNA25_25310 [Phycisphaerae bacterium]|nr:hypothetical protein [Phycisphaerae bacterium]
MGRLYLPLVLFAAWCVLGCEKLPQRADEPLAAPVQSSPWDNPRGRGSQLQTANYRIFTTANNHRLASILPGFMEASRRNYLRILNLPERPAGKLMPMYVLGTREEWAALTRSVLGEQAEKFLMIESGGYCYKEVCVLWEMGGLGTLLVAAHEGMHQFIHHRLSDQLPMWLEEGLCTQAEGYEIEGRRVSFSPKLNLSRNVDLEQTIARRFWIPIDRLLPMDAGDAVGGYTERTVGYYGQLWALVQFIRSDPSYSAGLDRLLADAEAGRLNEALGVPRGALKELRLRGRAYNQTVSEPLFKHYICDDLKTFEKRFKHFAARLAKLE